MVAGRGASTLGVGATTSTVVPGDKGFAADRSVFVVVVVGVAGAAVAVAFMRSDWMLASKAAVLTSGVDAERGAQVGAFRSGKRKRTGNSLSPTGRPVVAVLMAGVRSK